MILNLHYSLLPSSVPSYGWKMKGNLRTFVAPAMTQTESSIATEAYPKQCTSCMSGRGDQAWPSQNLVFLPPGSANVEHYLTSV